MKKYCLPSLLMLSLSSCVLADQLALPPVIDNSSYPETAPPPAPANTANDSAAMYQLVQRIDKLQAEVQQLTGKVEEQGNQINELKKQQSSMYSDIDERLQRLEKTGVASSPSAENTATSATETPAPSNETTPTPVAAPQPQPEVQNTNITVTPPPAPAAENKPAPQPEIKASGDEKQIYQQAYNALRSGKTDDSIQQFQTYLSQYPNGGYADLANYWLGEAYRVKPDINAARQAFNTVLQQYPNSTKIAETLLKLGYLEADEKNNDKAREYLNRVVNEFPNTPAARSAAKKLTQLK